MTHHKRYLTPEDVAEEHARQAIDAVNGMRSAQELADAVEVPGEPDIGIRLAQRILDRRDELGGFTTLAQINDVPLIGPERFTELVVCLSAAPWPDRPLSPLDALRRDFELLQRRVDALGTFDAGRRITLRAVQPQPFLGQTVTIVAEVIDGGGRPAIDVPVTLLATRGRLAASDGYTTVQGHLVTARTGIDGRLRITLSLPPAEDLSQIQQSALARAIAQLGAAAETPADALEGLRELAREYAWEINLPLRQAVDSYASEFAPTRLDTFTPRDPLAAWRHIECGVLAFAPLGAAAEVATSVAATATLNLGFRDWIRPFLTAAIELSRAETDLRTRLRDATAGEEDASRFVGAVYSQAGAYIARQHGVLGAYIAQKTAETSIRDFITRELPEALPLEARTALLPALNAASRTIATTDASVLQGLVRARTELRVGVGNRGVVDPGMFGNFADRLGTLENRVAVIPDRLGALENRVAVIPDRLGALEDVVAGIPNRLGAVESAVAGLPDNATIDALRGDMLARIAEERAAVDGRIDTTRRQLDTAIARKADATAVNQRLTTMDASISALRFRPPL